MTYDLQRVPYVGKKGCHSSGEGGREVRVQMTIRQKKEDLFGK